MLFAWVLPLFHFIFPVGPGFVQSVTGEPESYIILQRQKQIRIKISIMKWSILQNMKSTDQIERWIK